MRRTQVPKESVYFVGHYDTAITDDLVWDLVAALRPERQSNVEHRPITRREEEEAVERWKDHPAGYDTAAFYYPRPQAPGQRRSRSQVEFVVDLQVSGRWRLSHKEVLEMPSLIREPKRWFLIAVGGSRIDHDDPFEMAWLFGKIHAVLPVLRPDFAFADVRPNFFASAAKDPRRRVWPVLLYGPAWVERLGGREKVLEAPAWRVEELEGGSMWIQVAENPFMASAAELERLAAYLGLDAG